MEDQELRKKLEQMSPEELAAFQKQQCIFCQIIAGKIPSRMVYKDDTVVAVLDINPAGDGHVLVMPKEHYAVMPQLPEEELRHLGTVVKGVSQTCITALGVEGTSVFVANGPSAGQRAQHFMVHVIPRSKDDGLPLSLDLKEITQEKLDYLREQLTKLLGKTPQKVPSEAPPKQEQAQPEGGADLDAIAKLLK